jgi:hypothetical protein
MYDTCNTRTTNHAIQLNGWGSEVLQKTQSRCIIIYYILYNCLVFSCILITCCLFMSASLRVYIRMELTTGLVVTLGVSYTHILLTHSYISKITFPYLFRNLLG